MIKKTKKRVGKRAARPKKATSDRVSRIAAECMRMLRENPRERWFGVTRGQLNALAGSALSQDEVKGKRVKGELPEWMTSISAAEFARAIRDRASNLGFEKRAARTARMKRKSRNREPNPIDHNGQ